MAECRIVAPDSESGGENGASNAGGGMSARRHLANKMIIGERTIMLTRPVLLSQDIKRIIAKRSAKPFGEPALHTVYLFKSVDIAEVRRKEKGRRDHFFRYETSSFGESFHDGSCRIVCQNRGKMAEDF